MLRHRSVSRRLSDQAFAQLRSRLVYKAGWYGCNLVVADRWYPSSKTCAACQQVNRDLPRGAARWTCPGCGVLLDRDVNAATNLARWPTADRPKIPD